MAEGDRAGFPSTSVRHPYDGDSRHAGAVLMRVAVTDAPGLVDRVSISFQQTGPIKGWTTVDAHIEDADGWGIRSRQAPSGRAAL